MKKAILVLLNVYLLMFLLCACTSQGNKVVSSAPVKNQSLLNDQSSNEKKETLQNNQSTPASAQSDVDKVAEIVPEAQASILLKSGDSGDKVIELQKKLYNIGYDVGVDGDFGNQTSEALKAFQKTKDITPTGNYDNITDAALKTIKDVRSYTPPKPVVIANNQSSVAPASQPSTTPSKEPATIPNIKTDPGDAQQVIVVLATSYGTISATFKNYEKVSGIWQLINSGGAVVGKAGFRDNRHEGDMSTPTGKYGISFMFGNADNPGVKFTYKKVQVGDYWVSNKIIEEYNVWMHYDGTDADARFYDYEALWEQPLYKYAAVIDFNYGPDRVLGKGSGIFLHIAPYSGGGTAGCVGVSEGNLISILKWLDPAKKPVIIMGVNGSI